MNNLSAEQNYRVNQINHIRNMEQAQQARLAQTNDDKKTGRKINPIRLISQIILNVK